MKSVEVTLKPVGENSSSKRTNLLLQNVFFDPMGLLGLLYGYALEPFTA